MLKRITRRLWFRAGLLSVLGVATALLALGLKGYIPQTLSARIGADAVDNILGVLASSMLATTTFSLNIMVSAYSSATENATPRATPLLVEDATTQNVLATFIGSFLFSLVGIIALSTGVYGNNGRVVLFAVTICVIALIVYTLLRWIDHLATLGRLGETTDRVEAAATSAMCERLKHPYLGGARLQDGPISVPADARAVLSGSVGYVVHVDVLALASLSRHATAVYVHVIPGSFVHARTALASVSSDAAMDDERIRDAFTVGVRRDFEEDPRFGISVLAEIASRALSPALNDPGTAIDVIGRGVRVLSNWAKIGEVGAGVRPGCDRVFVPGIQLDDMFDDFFGPIARDGAGILEVGMRLQKALGSLACQGDDGFRAAAQRHSRLALSRAEVALQLQHEKEVLRVLANEVGKSAPLGRFDAPH
jgi:uncharacterized membrane protein